MGVEIGLFLVTLVSLGFVVRSIMIYRRQNADIEDRLDELEHHILPHDNYHRSYFRPTAKKEETK